MMTTMEFRDDLQPYRLAYVLIVLTAFVVGLGFLTLR